MATMNPTTWASFYDIYRNNGGAVEALFNQGDDTLSAIAKSHLRDKNKLIATITGSEGLRSTIVGAFQSRICRLSPNHRLSESRLILLVTSELLTNSSMRARTTCEP